jgi:hypothetical protein
MTMPYIFSGDEDDEEPLYICPLNAGINVIGSGIDQGVSNFKSDVFDPLSINETPHWLHSYPIQQLLKLTMNFLALSHEDVSGENDEAAHSKRRVNANHYPRDLPLEDTCRK